MPENKREQAKGIEAWFSHCFSELLERLESDPATKEYNFRGFRFPLISFERKTLSKPVSFTDAVFSGSNADFSWTNFEERAEFNRAKFLGMASFNNATFKKEALFWETRFKEDAWFSGTKFENERSHFTDTRFGKPSSFSYAVFGKGAKFSRVTFEKSVSFNWTTFDQDTVFQGDAERRCFSDGCEFAGLRLRKDASLFFDHVDLSKATFLDTNLESIGFRGVQWHAPKTRPRRKRALWDEFRPQVSERTYPHVAENYAQLVSNYEKKRDYEAAEDFHIGEMEIRRKAVEAEARRRNWKKYLSRLNSYQAYRFLSNYGTSYWQAIMVLLGLILLSSWVLLFTGLRASDGQSVIHYKFFSTASSVSAALQWMRDYLRAIVFTLSVVTLQRQRAYEPLGNWSHLWTAIASLLLAGQAALILLAIRRRFRR